MNCPIIFSCSRWIGIFFCVDIVSFLSNNKCPIVDVWVCQSRYWTLLPHFFVVPTLSKLMPYFSVIINVAFYGDWRNFLYQQWTENFRGLRNHLYVLISINILSDISIRVETNNIERSFLFKFKWKECKRFAISLTAIFEGKGIYFLSNLQDLQFLKEIQFIKNNTYFIEPESILWRFAESLFTKPC